MRDFFNKKLTLFFRDFIPVLFALSLTFFLSRCYELSLLIYHHNVPVLNFHYLAGSLLSDFQTIFVAAIPVGFLYKLLKKITPESSISFTAGAITVIGLCNVLLSTYFSATLIPLGSELWAYSTAEITNTVIASKRLSAWGFLFITTATILLFRLVKKLFTVPVDKLNLNLVGTIPFVGIAVVAAPLILSIPDKKLPADNPANKLAYFFAESIKENQVWDRIRNNKKGKFDREFPFLHRPSTSDVLGPFFNDSSAPPNIVFFIVESLGGEFIGENGQWTGFAPYLDSLAQQSLYWNNGLSLSGRTFGVMPALLGSLPSGKNGFMNLGPDYPAHLTLISWLKNRGYHTAFFSGYDTYFDDLNYFLEYQGTDVILDKQTIEAEYITPESEATQNYWGFDDKTMFTIASGLLDSTISSPRLEIYHTVQSHSPFTVPDPERYSKEFNKRLTSINPSSSKKKAYKQYESELTTLLYTDDAIQGFMREYRKRKEYNNTIFIITGDHWLIPVPQTSRISRYHVPLIIYSPLLKHSVQFESVNTHANIVPSITSYLEKNYNLPMPETVHWIGGPMDTVQYFRNIHSLPMMKNKNKLSDFLDGQYYLTDDRLYTISEKLRLVDTLNKTIKERLRKKLDHYKSKNRYAISNNKLYPDNNPKTPDKYNFIVRFDTLFQRIDSLNLNPDEQYQFARKLAFEGHYYEARATCKRLLMRFPGYLDARLLLGRTFAWEEKYGKARTLFKRVLDADPTYYDTYNALFDTEYWDGNLHAALQVINKGLEKYPSREQFLEKKVRVLADLRHYSEAQKIFKKLKNNYPDNEKLTALKKYISDY